MGTHNYKLVISKELAGRVNLSFPFYRSFRDVIDGAEKKAGDSYGCREVLVGTFGQEVFKKVMKGKIPLIVGIVCYGQTYSYAYTSLSENRGAKINKLKKFFRDVLDLNLRIYLNKSTNKLVSLSRNKTIRLEGSVSLIFDDFKDKKPVSQYLISLILALFREPLFYNGVIEGNIKTLDDTIKVLIDIAHKRRLGEESFYEYIPYTSGSNVSDEKLQYEKIERLKRAFNADGSDFLSILGLALFLEIYNNNKKNDNLFEYRYSGPSNYAFSSATKEDVKDLVKLSSNRIIKDITKDYTTYNVTAFNFIHLIGK